MTKPTYLIISQVYVPDPASVGQHIADAAAEMVRRGYRVVVYASARGYDDPTKKYASREVRDGVEIRRLPLSSLGKSSIAVRLLAQWIFLAQAFVRSLFTRKLVGIMVSTSPPFCGFVGAVLAAIRGVPFTYWLMDLNPDQMVVLGKMRETSVPARVIDWMQKFAAQTAAHVVVMDRFMAERLLKKFPPATAEELRKKLTAMPPWPHEDELAVVAHEENPFRKAHGLDGKFVVMYSGNHGYSTPVKTVVDAALKIEAEGKEEDKDIVFLFIGGGVGKKDVDDAIAQHKPKNLRSLPYQPLKDLRYSLSAADVHVVTVGDTVVGVVHPCKIYGAMAVSRPILLVAPDPCHASDIVKDNGAGWHIKHGDVDGAVATIRGIARTAREQLGAMGAKAKGFIDTKMKKDVLCEAFCDILQRGTLGGAASARGAARHGSQGEAA